MNFLTTTLPLRAYLFTFAVFVTLLSYMYKTALVSVAAALISHETNRLAIKKGKHFNLPHIFLPTDPNTPFSEKRDCVTKNFKTHSWYLQKVALKGFCTENIVEKMANTGNQRLLGASSWMNWIVNEHGCKVPLLLNFVIKFRYCWQPNVEDYHLCIHLF